MALVLASDQIVFLLLSVAILSPHEMKTMDGIFGVFLAFTVGAALSGLATWLVAAQRISSQAMRAVAAETSLAAEQAAHAERATALQKAEQRLIEISEALVRAETNLSSERANHAEKLTSLQETEQRLRDAFANLSTEALSTSSVQLIQLAQERFERQQESTKSDLTALVEPLRLVLDQQRDHLQRLEQARQHAYGSIEAQLKRMTDDQERLQQETANLVKALRQPHIRGRWGEIQLRQVVELAGMSAHCDFLEQQSIGDTNGERGRPDLQVRLPNQRVIVVDAKVPLSAYLEALDASDDGTRLEHLKNHARQVRAHVNEMAKREYQRKIGDAHDFLILFIPGDTFYNAALEHDRELLEYAFGKNIILATPATLIGLLKAVALGWREARLAKEALRIKQEGELIYKHLSTLAGHITELGKALRKSVNCYNGTIGSIERNLLSSARRLAEMEVSTISIADIQAIEEFPRSFSKTELLVDMLASEQATDDQVVRMRDCTEVSPVT
jgi:DNA recombination protein RmuC